MSTLNAMSQEDKLFVLSMFDQHQREHAASVNRMGYRARPRPDGRGAIRDSIMGFVSPPVPIGWKPPFPELYPPAECFTQDPNKPMQIRIDYDKWYQMSVDGMDDWTRALQITAEMRYPSNAGEVIANPTPDLLKQVGRRPLHVDFIVAMMNGNRWALGQPSLSTGERYPTPKWATPILDSVGSLQKPTRDPSREAAKFADEDEAPELTEEDIDWTGTQYDPKYMDEEESADPQALGGRRVPVKAPRMKRGDAAHEA